MPVCTAARPWVYWFWLNGNITSNGITADLEAMARVGIGGVLIMEVDQGAPVGPVDFMGSSWRNLFRHAAAEAARLGLEINSRRWLLTVTGFWTPATAMARGVSTAAPRLSAVRP